MKYPLTLLAASSAIAIAFGLPASSAMHTSDHFELQSRDAVFEVKQDAPHLIFVSDDDDDDHRSKRRGHDDDDDEGDDDDDHDGKGDRNGARNPAPAGTVAPPQNGLFGNGAAPTVKVN